MDMQTANEKAKALIKSNRYLVLSTSDKEGEPWAATVFYAEDDEYNFYFISAIDSLHAKNIRENSRVAFVIFDSHSEIGYYDAVQASGTAKALDRDEVKSAIDFYCKKLSRESGNPDLKYDPMSYAEPSEFRVFKITTTRVYTTSEERRTEVDLNRKD